MNITEYSVRRPVTVTVLCALAVGIALALIPGLAVDLFPSTSRPVLSVFTSFSGAGPADVERNLTEPLEKALAGAKGLKSMSSNSSFESSSISLTFGYGTDMAQAQADLESILSRVAGALPDGAGSPTVRRFDMSSLPIMRLVVRGSYPPDQLRRLSEDIIQAGLERIDGVASAETTGGSTQVVGVDVSLNRLAAFNLTLGDIVSALRGQSVLSSGGSLVRGSREFQILTRQELDSLDEVRRLVIKTVSFSDGASGRSVNRSQVVRLEDVADVNLAYNDSSARVYVNGQSGVYLQVQKEDGSNSVHVSRRVRAALEDINAELPAGVTLEILSDNTSLINATLDQVYSNALQGGILAMAILFIFLRNIKATFIIGLAIPISILLTLMAMAVFGFTLNLLTLTGLILGLGMIVDGSIVILENIHNYRERGAKPDVAAILGSHEMVRAIVASTATTLCVFIPVIIFKNDLEMMGQLFNDLVFTVVISLVASLVVALTIVPALSGPIMKLDTRLQKPLRNPLLRGVDNGMEAFFRLLERGYRRALEYSLSRRLLVLLFVSALLAFSLVQFEGMGMNLFVRSRTDDSVSISLTMPQGSTIDETEKVLLDLQRAVEAQVEGYRNIIVTARRPGRGGSQGTLQITLPEPAAQIDTPASIQQKLTPIISAVPGVRASFSAGRGFGGSSPVDISVSSRDREALAETAEEIRGILERHLPQVESPVVNIDEGGPQLEVELDRDRAAALGVSLSAVASEIRIAMNGSSAGSLTRGDQLVGITVRLREEDRRGLPNLDAVSVMSRGGSRVPLSNVARIVENRSPSSIRREDQARVLRVTGGLAPGIAATEMQALVKATVTERLIHREGVSVTFRGEAEEINRYSRSFLYIILAAVLLVFGVMASQFESFVDPLIIFFSIPLLFIGVIWVYKISGEPFSLFSAVGVVALVGIVVNNGIVLVDYTNTLRQRGLAVRDACLEAGRSRLRPILMTSLTTILGMVPIAFFPGAGADTIQPIGKTMVGGLAVASFMTLIVTPVMYSLLNSRHDRARKRKGVK